MEYGLIGEHLGHSFSKIIHNRLTDYPYELKEIPKEELSKFMLQKDFKAINVTIPYKEAVIPFLDFVSDTAMEIGAVNTIVNKNGKLYGYNTDFSGMSLLLEKNGIDLKDKKVLILGSGGTSKTALAVAKHLKAEEVYRVSRRGGEDLITYSELKEKHSDAQIIINTTPCGMYPNIGSVALDISGFESLIGVADAVYNPLSSSLIIEAKKRGLNTCGGLYMLIAQAVFAAELFLEKQFDKGIIDSIYSEILREKKNIVLIGMPGSGKSTIGRLLAESLNKDFIDTDTEIEKQTGLKIPEIFAQKGEKGFREIESKVIRVVSAFQGKIIATGGGAVLNPQNIDLLKGNGVVFFLDRDINDITATSDRPLSSNREDLIKRYNERYAKYLAGADFSLKIGNNAEINANALKEVFINENFGD